MKTVYFLICVCFLPLAGLGQHLSVLTNLSQEVQESSGLVYLNEKIITINDSGGLPALYEIDSTSGNVIRTVTVENASNIDWEELSMDDNYIYICDFGNNSGSRTNLRIYLLAISDYLNTPNDTVNAEIIEFSYSDQVDFTPSNYTTNFDAEAAIVSGDSIYVFTKNWGDNNSNVYSLPKVPGNYQANKIATINTEGLITGASYNMQSGSVLLTGYAIPTFFLLELSDFNIDSFSFSSMNRFELPIPTVNSMQVESITPINESHYLLSSEKSFFGSSSLFSLSMEGFASLTSIPNQSVRVYPNPASSIVNIESELGSELIVFAQNGAKLYSGEFKSEIISIDVSEWKHGVYTLQIKSDNQQTGFYKLIK